MMTKHLAGHHSVISMSSTGFMEPISFQRTVLKFMILGKFNKNSIHILTLKFASFLFSKRYSMIKILTTFSFLFWKQTV